MSGFQFFKGHGTKNDFVLLPDADGSVHAGLTEDTIRALCDRRGGIGGDGILRVVRTTATDDPAAVAARGDAEWFMDYRNSDGSLSEMCGNGVRVFARYLIDYEGVEASQPLRVATRAGIKVLTVEADGQITVDMGAPEIFAETKVEANGHSWAALHISMGNPHAVAFVEDLTEPGPLLDSPGYDAEVYPLGANIEFVVRRGERHVAMRVHERGSGETQSCGTGACAVAVATALADRHEADGTSYRVDVPGGTLHIAWTADRHILMTGPAVVVAEGYWFAT
jgi:diaminopimelate epimerase